MYVLALRGEEAFDTIGLSTSIAERLEQSVDTNDEEQSRWLMQDSEGCGFATPPVFAAFKMPHPLDNTSRVIIGARNARTAACDVARVCDTIRSDLNGLIKTLERELPDTDAVDYARRRTHYKEGNERHHLGVSIGERQIAEEA